jgi:hypothetical protein
MKAFADIAIIPALHKASSDMQILALQKGCIACCELEWCPKAIISQIFK